MRDVGSHQSEPRRGAVHRAGRAAWLCALAVLGLLAAPAAFAVLDDQTVSRLPAKTSDSYAIAAGDVDGDADADLLAANRGGVTLLLNNGGGTFTDGAARLPALSGTFFAAAVVDVDGDLDRDIVLANASGPERLLVNNGSGTFTDESATRLPASADATTDVVAADLDRDGKVDLVFANRGGAVRVLRNGGAGVFSDITSPALLARSDRAQALAVADVNGDGAADLFVGVDGATSRLYLGNGLGVFTDATATALPGVTLAVQGAAFADVDADGDADLLLAAGPAGVVLLRNGGAGIFSAAPGAALPALAEAALGLAVGDVDFDGALDVVVATAGQDRVLRGDGQGAFIDITAAQLPNDDSRSFGALLLDVDADFDLDLAVAKPAAQNRLFVNLIPFPRIRLSRSPNYVETGDPVTIRADVFDEDGLSSVVLTVNGAPLALANGQAIFTPLAAGPQTALVTARDTLGNVGTRSLAFSVATPDTTQPQLTLSVAPPTLLRGQSVTIQASATDDRAVKSLGVTVDGAPIALDTTGKAVLIGGTLGVHTVIATALDFADNVGTKSGTFEVLPDSVLPVVTLSALPNPAPLATPVSIQVGATDNVSVASLALEVSGPGIAGAQPLTIGAGGQASFTPYLNGTYSVTGRATDPSGNVGTRTVNFDATGTPDTTLPVVTLSGIPGTVSVNAPLSISVSATDDVLVSSLILKINGVPVALAANGTATYTPLAVGPYDVVATATDPTGNAGIASASFNAVDPAGDVSPPVVSITSPADDANVTQVANVIGSVNDVTLTGWTLSAARTDGGAFTQVAAGTTPVTNGLLGLIDPTMFENGFYTLRVDAQDVNGLTASATSVVEVTGALKLGEFSVSFRDKNIDCCKVPLEVTRAYDSRRRTTSGDFGFGWQIALNEIYLVENRSPGEAWRSDRSGGFIPTYFLVADRPHTVSITIPGEKTIRFAAEPNPKQQQLFPIEFLNGMDYVRIGDTKGTLVANEQPDLFLNGEIVDLNFDKYNPATFTYTDEDGFIYVFTDTSGGQSLRHKLTRLTDPNGVTVDYGSNGFSSSNGQSLAFVRDAQGRITKITDPNGFFIQYQYDASGNLVAVIDEENNRTELVYAAGHYLSEIRDPLGRPQQRQEYGPDGRLVAITDATGERVEFSYDLGANTQVVRDRRGNASIYEYDGRGNLLEETKFPIVNGAAQAVTIARTYNGDNDVLTEADGRGTVTRFTYATGGELLTKVVDPGGLNFTTTSTYDGKGRILTQTDPRGAVVTNAYDANGNLLTRTERDGGVTGWTYDAQGRATRVTDALGQYTTIAYDAQGRRTAEERFSATNVRLQRKTFTWDSNGNKLTESVTVTAPGGARTETTTWTYDKLNRTTSARDPAGNVKRSEYDILGNVTAEIDGLGRRTTNTYDARGSLLRTDFPDGSFAEYGYDSDGNRISERDRNGHLTQYTVDVARRILRAQFADGAISNRYYDAAGYLIGEQNALGQRTDHTVDAAGRRTRTQQPSVLNALTSLAARPTTDYEYDANGNRTALVDANGRRTEFSFDARDRETQVLLPDGRITRTSFDLLGNAIAKTDAAGAISQYSFDALGRLVKTSLPPAQGGGARLDTAFAFDEALRLVSQTDANGRITRFEWDVAGNETARVLPGTQRETFGYDAANRRIRHVDFKAAGTDFDYDEIGRQTFVRYADASTVTTTYLGEGQPVTVTDARGPTTHAYDVRNRLVSVNEPGGVSLTYGYDLVGNRTSVTSLAGVTRYAYDALSRLASVTDPAGGVTTYGYDLVGNLIRVAYPNGSSANYAYNTRNQLTGVVHRQSGGAVIASFTYTLDPNGLRTQVAEADGTITTYTYDAVYRLTREVRVGTTPYDVQYSYDAVGNRTSMNRNGTVTNYSYDSNDRLTSVGAETRAYDANGDLTSRTSGGQSTTYVYDAARRLAGVTAPGGAVTTYGYDARGNRISKTDASGTTRYVVDVRSRTGDVPQVIEERGAGNALRVAYTHGLDLVSQSRAGSRSFYHYDGLGSTRVLTNDAAAVSDSYTYDAYGQEVASTGSTPNLYRFAGEQLDPNVGFYYLRARYYEPATGRFLGIDPERGDPQSPASLHRYLYAASNPVNFVDPTGRFFSMISISISISINTSIQSIYTTNLVKFFFKAAKIAFCSLQPAYKLQELAMDMIMSDVPGGYDLYVLSQTQIAGAFRAIGQEIVNTYKNIASEIVDVKVEVSGLLADLYNAYTSGSIPVPVPQEVQKLLDFKDKLEGYLDKAKQAYDDVQLLATGDACNVFTALDNQADNLLKLVPAF